MTSFASEDDYLRDQVSLKTQTIKFIREKIDELNDSSFSGPLQSDELRLELVNVFSQGIGKLQAEIIEIEEDMHSEPGVQLSEHFFLTDNGEIFAINDAIECINGYLEQHNMVTVSGAGAWLVHQKVAEAHHYGIKKLKADIVELEEEISTNK